MSFIQNSRVMVPGGAGFLGQFVCEELKKYNPADIFVPRSRNCDLRDRDSIRALFKFTKPEIIIHLAAVVGGIGANRFFPGRFFFENAIMGIQLMEEARLHRVDKFVTVGTACSYPKFTSVPFKEEDLWNGYPEETNAAYGLAKKMLLVQAQAYRQQYGFNAITLIPANLYGPGDNFNPATSHVIPALIRKVLENRRGCIDVWGTGNASREFLFVRDAAEGIILATENYSRPDPINLGSGKEITILDLAQEICALCDFQGEIHWDHSQPDGQPRRCLDTTKAFKEFGFKARTEFQEGLKETISWYKKVREIN